MALCEERRLDCLFERLSNWLALSDAVMNYMSALSVLVYTITSSPYTIPPSPRLNLPPNTLHKLL